MLAILIGTLLCAGAVPGYALATAPVAVAAADGAVSWDNLYREHRLIAWAVALVVALQTVAIIVLTNGARQRHRASRMLRESEERFRMLAESSLTGTYLVSGDETVLYVNRTLAEMLGYRPEEIIGSNFRSFICPEDQQQVVSNYDKRLAGQAVPANYEVRGLHRSGRLIELELFASISRSCGEPAIIGTVLDISARKQAERAVHSHQQQLEEMNRILEQRITEEVEKCREMDRVVMQQARFAAMGEMIGNIAHQWRQPLNTLGLVIQRMQMEHEKGNLTREVMEERVATGMDLLLCLSRTIDDFRNFFRPGLEPRSFSLSKAISTTVDFFEPGCAAHGIRVTVEGNCTLRYNGHVNEFAQALLNILNNARDALEERKVRQPVITVSLSEAEGRGIVAIRDNAGGIAPAVLERIFDPYFTTKEEGRGTGIGLYMARSIIERQMQGRIDVRNSREGAEFTITL